MLLAARAELERRLKAMALLERFGAGEISEQAALLSLFGAGFEAGYSVMFVLAIGLLARASVGPAERLLNMIGQRRQCATVYAVAFVINLTLCVILVPRHGIEGAAAATSTALVAESLMFSWVAKQRLGFTIFVFGRPKT